MHVSAWPPLVLIRLTPTLSRRERGLQFWACRARWAICGGRRARATRPAAALADLEYMFNKLMFSGLGLMAAVAAPIVFFYRLRTHGEADWRARRPRHARQRCDGRRLHVGPRGPQRRPPPRRHAVRGLAEVFLRRHARLDHAALAAGRPPAWASCSCKATGCRWSPARGRATWPAR